MGAQSLKRGDFESASSAFVAKVATAHLGSRDIQNYEQLAIVLTQSRDRKPSTTDLTASLEEGQWPEEKPQPYPELLR